LGEVYSDAFTIDVDIAARTESGESGAGIGIVESSMTLATLKTLRTTSDRKDLALYALAVDGKTLTAEDQGCPVPEKLCLNEVRHIRMQCFAGVSPKLLVSVNGGEAVDITMDWPLPIRPGSYKPVVVLARASKIRCFFRQSRKRPIELEGECLPAKTNRALWANRNFTDVVVMTADGESIPCHRVFLANGSPVFAAELERWTGSPPQIKATGPRTAVEPMLEFFYTGELSECANAAALLPVAHFYQVEHLIWLAIDRLLSSLTPQTAVAAAEALRPLRKEDAFQEVWLQFCEPVSRNINMISALADQSQ